MKNVLFITYYFPPGASSGVFRPSKFVKYLKNGRDWNPVVLTMEEAYYAKCDPSLSKDVPEELDIYRVDSLQPLPGSDDERFKKVYHQAHMPDSAFGGIMHFVLKGLEIINNRQIDLIFCTIPHPSMAVVGMLLKQMTGIPLVVEYRDGWTTNPMMKPRTEEGRQVNQYMESRVLAAADGIVVVDEQLKQDVCSLGFKGEIEVILNGFDQDDFKNTDKYAFDRPQGGQIISYCGHIYRDYIPALARMADAISAWNERYGAESPMKLYLAGEFQHVNDREVLLSKDHVSYEGHLNYRDSIAFTSSSDASVGVMTLEYSMGGKFYNLMLSDQYIFAFVNPRNERIKQLLNDYTGKRFLPLDAPLGDIVQAIQEWNTSGGRKRESYMPPGYLKEYSREQQTRQLEAVWNRIVGK